MDNKLSSDYRAVLKLSLVLSYRNDAALKDNFLINCFFAQMHKTTPHHRNCYPAVMQVSVIHYNTF